MLPEITTPPGIPQFRHNSNAIQLLSLYADIPMRTGSMRKRRLYTAAPRIVQVEWFLTAAQMATVESWYQDDLHVGELWFSSRLRGTGGTMQWFKTRWLEPYQQTPMSGGYWTVTGKLLIEGDASDAPPENTTLGLEVGAFLTGSAAVTVETVLALEIAVALRSLTQLSLEVTVPLTASAAFPIPDDFNALQREDSGYVLREDGFKFTRE